MRTTSGLIGVIFTNRSWTSTRLLRRNGFVATNYRGYHAILYEKYLTEINFSNGTGKTHGSPTGNQVTYLKRQAIKSFCYDASRSVKKPAEFRKKMKSLLPNSSHSKHNNIVLLDNENIVTDPALVAETLNEYFTNVAAPGENTTFDRPSDYNNHPSIASIALSYLMNFLSVRSAAPTFEES